MVGQIRNNNNNNQNNNKNFSPSSFIDVEDSRSEIKLDFVSNLWRQMQVINRIGTMCRMMGVQIYQDSINVLEDNLSADVDEKYMQDLEDLQTNHLNNLKKLNQTSKINREKLLFEEYFKLARYKYKLLIQLMSRKGYHGNSGITQIEDGIIDLD